MAIALLSGALALPSMAAIVTSGEVNPSPVGGTVVGRLSIGQAGSGTVTVNAGSALSGDVIGLGEQLSGNGALTVSGVGSRVALVPTGTTGNLDIGSQGTGSVSVLAGASFVYGVAQNGACANNCRLFVSNAAGSNGSVLVSGAGSSFTTPGQITVGNASVFTLATDGFNYGTPGGASQGSFRVEAGGTVSSSRLIIGNPGGGLGRNGSERSSGSVVVDGAGSFMSVVRNANQTAGISLLSMGTGAGAQGALDIQNGGRLRIDGNASLNLPVDNNLFAGANIGNGLNSSAVVRVDGAGSRLELAGPLGFINLGTSFAGANGQLQVTNGGVVTGVDANALPFLTVGRDGGTGILTVSGNDAAGNASLLRLAGRNPSTDGGAFMSVGRNFGAGAGTGTVNIRAGGRMEIDTTALTLTNPNGQTGMYIGIGTGSTGALNIDGRSALTGAASTLTISAGSGLTPYMGIGRDGAAGALNITGGGKMVVNSSHVSVPNAGGYLQGDAMLLEIGLRVGAAPAVAATSGTVTVSGAGSELAMTGSVDRGITIGSGINASGALNILAGGTVRSLFVLVGTSPGGSGELNMNAGRLILDGVRNGGPVANTGAGMSLGRAGGQGTANISNGSTITISSTAPQAFIAVGGTGFAPGGVGTVSISGGSTVSVNSPDARIFVGSAGSAAQLGIGTLSLSGAGTSLSANGVGAKVQIGASDNTVGTLVVGAGATLTSSSLIGVVHDGSASSGGSGVLIVNGIANAANLHVGTNGLLGGAGIINANVFNHGVINPGNSPGRLTVNGDFDNSDGKIVLEVKMLPDGSFVYDEIVFGNPLGVTMGMGRIEFDFEDDTDPTAFLNSGKFNLASFFKELLGGDVVDLAADHRAWFNTTQFGARADSYNFSSFSFDPVTGASFTANAIPLPASAWLVLAGLLAVHLAKPLAQARQSRGERES